MLSLDYWVQSAYLSLPLAGTAGMGPHFTHLFIRLLTGDGLLLSLCEPCCSPCGCKIGTVGLCLQLAGQSFPVGGSSFLLEALVDTASQYLEAA